MARQPVEREGGGGGFHHRLDAAGGAHADGVGDVDLIAAERRQPLDHIDDRRHRHLALVRTAQRARDRPAQPDARVLGGPGHRHEPFDRFGDRAVDVLLRERLAGRAEDHHFIGERGGGGLETLHVGRQRGIQRAGPALDARHHVGAVGHLGHPPGRHERRGLHVDEAGVGQAVHQLHLGLGGHRRLLVLQAVARADLDYFHKMRERHLSNLVADRRCRRSARRLPARGSCARSGQC